MHRTFSLLWLLTAPAFAQTPDAGPLTRDELGADTLTATLDGFSRKQLRDEGYQLVRGTVQSVKRPDPKHTVVTLTSHGKTRVVRFTHPPKLALPVAEKEELEVEVGEVKGGFDPNHSTPYVRVAGDVATLVVCNTDGTRTDDPAWRRGARVKDVDATTFVSSATVSFGKERFTVQPDAWQELTVTGGRWLVWQHYDGLRPDAPPANRTSRSEACAVRVR